MENLFNCIVHYRIECLPEDLEVRGNAVVSGDPEYDKQIEDKIINDLNNGNEWAWCYVKVTAYIDGLPIEGNDCLGGCSYQSQKDFEQDSMFEDMKDRALTDLKINLNDLVKNLKSNGLI